MERERVFILAASQEQAAIFARRWVAEGEGRGLTDAIYLTRYTRGHFVTPQDRVVQLEGSYLNRDIDRIETELIRTLAKTGLTWDHVEKAVPVSG